MMKIFCVAGLAARAAAGGTANVRRRATTAAYPTRASAGVETPSPLLAAASGGSLFRSTGNSTGTSSTSAIIGQTTTAEERVARGGQGGGGSPSPSGVVFFSVFGFLLALFLLYHILLRYCRKHGLLGPQGGGRVDVGQRLRDGSNAVARQRGGGERGDRAVTGATGAAPIAGQALVPMTTAN
eukprot:g7308.t1